MRWIEQLEGALLKLPPVASATPDTPVEQVDALVYWC